MDERLRDFVRKRAGGRCEYCRIPQDFVAAGRFHIEHIRARQHGGTDEPENLALACRKCNRFKGPNLTSIDPQTAQVTRLFHPRTDKWNEHFTLVANAIVGLTEIGRASVILLEMNDPDRMRLRALLVARGLDVI